MTFRGSIPSGQAFNGQQPMAYPAYPQYGSGPPHANPQYQTQQFVPSYPQPPAQYYPLNTQQPGPYDGAYDRQPLPPPPPPAAPPVAPHVQYVDPFYPQQAVNPITSYQPAPPPPPVAHHQLPQPPLQPVPSNNSPRMDMHRLPSQGAHAKPATSTGPRGSHSGAAVTKSPLASHAPLQVETLPLLVCVAEDCFSKARASVIGAGRSRDANAVGEYHKLIATGLGCLEVAMQSNKLWPRLEARLRLRYAGVLIEETANTMEAETALTKGISLCDKVHTYISSL